MAWLRRDSDFRLPASIFHWILQVLTVRQKQHALHHTERLQNASYAYLLVLFWIPSGMTWITACRSSPDNHSHHWWKRLKQEVVHWAETRWKLIGIKKSLVRTPQGFHKGLALVVFLGSTFQFHVRSLAECSATSFCGLVRRYSLAYETLTHVSVSATVTFKPPRGSNVVSLNSSISNSYFSYSNEQPHIYNGYCNCACIACVHCTEEKLLSRITVRYDNTKNISHAS